MEYSLLVIIILLLSAGIYCQTSDPCRSTDHIIINDTTMDVSHTTINRHGFVVSRYNTWYRFTTTGQGILTNSCPQGNRCGTSSQAWSNDTLPGVHEGPKLVNVFIKGRNGCSDLQKNRVYVKNCNTFVVYKLVPLPPRYNPRYCFDTSLALLKPVSKLAPQTTKSTHPSSTDTSLSLLKPVTTLAPQTTKSTQPSSTGLSAEELAFIITGVIITVVAGAVALIVWKRKRRRELKVPDQEKEGNGNLTATADVSGRKMNANSRFAAHRLDARGRI